MNVTIGLNSHGCKLMDSVWSLGQLKRNLTQDLGTWRGGLALGALVALKEGS